MKKNLSSFLLVTSLLVTGCGHKNQVEEPPQKTHAQPVIALSDPQTSVHHSVWEESQDQAEILLSGSEVFTYPSDGYFTPLFLSWDDTLLGTLTADETVLTSCNLETGEYTNIQPPRDVSYTAIGIPYGDENGIIYECYDQNMGTTAYYYYDKSTEKNVLIKEICSIPPVHFCQVYASGQEMMLNLYNEQTGYYSNWMYTAKENKLSLVEENNCGYPVFVNGYWYWIAIDKQKHETSLIRYDGTDKEQLLTITGEDRYLSGLYSDGAYTVLLVHNNDTNECYLIDFAEGATTYLFEDSWMESVRVQNGKMRWLGEAKSEGRIRPQYYLYDLKERIHYEYTDGSLFLNDHGIAWIEYKKSDTEITKGNMYNNEYTRICYRNFTKPAAAPDPVVTDEPITPTEQEQPETPAVKASKVLPITRIIQETSYYCTPACVQMVLNYFGKWESQYVLAEKMNTSPVTGTEAEDLTRVINDYVFGYQPQSDADSGYRMTKTEYSSAEVDAFERRVIRNIDDGYPTFLQIEMSSLYDNGIWAVHQVLAIGYSQLDDGSVTLTILDPYYKINPGQNDFLLEDVIYSMQACGEFVYVW